MSKYSANNLVPMFRKAATLRNEMLASGFTDNGGAIHSAERILDILGQRLNYPNLSHLNNLRDYPNAELSPAALEAHQRVVTTTVAAPKLGIATPGNVAPLGSRRT